MRSFGGKRSATWNQDQPAATAGPAPGKRTLTETLPTAASHGLSGGVQRKTAGVEPGTEQIHASAQRGVSTASSPLPHAGTIQRLFGRHDISRVKAHVGADATASARDMGAQAYAMGDHVVLGDAADLHTVAHEAAHVVQQRSGAQLKGGVGEAGDSYERHADAVADKVVKGESAEALLDRHAAGGAGHAATPGACASAMPEPTVQRLLFERRESSVALTKLEDFAKLPPGTPLWENQQEVEVRYLGINRDEWSTIYLARPDGSPAIYRVTDGKTFPYDAGKPSKVKMAVDRVVNGDKLSDGAHHSGVMYRFEVVWNEVGKNTGNGVMVTEVITPIEANGWFAQSSERKQTIHLTMGPGDQSLDLVGISGVGKFSSEKQQVDSNTESARPTSSGSRRALQHFEYVDADGKLCKIPHSGFALLSKMEDGVLTIQRVPEKHSGVEAGESDGQEIRIVIKYGD